MHRNRMLTTYCLAAFMVGFFVTIQYKGMIVHAQAEATKPFLIDPTAVTLGQENSRGQKTAVGKPTIKEVQDYLRAVFGNGWKLAWDVSQNECSIKRSEWPFCVNSWGQAKDKGEHSVGMFQINLAKQGGQGAKVHWDKVPGQNLDEKQSYLMDWKQNILIAYVVSKSGTNWNPWTGYHLLLK
jgi:hypothetical protein